MVGHSCLYGYGFRLHDDAFFFSSYIPLDKLLLKSMAYQMDMMLLATNWVTKASSI